MKRKLVPLAVAMGIALAAAWAPGASALPRYCNATTCSPSTPPSYPCTCPGTAHVTTCGQWTIACGF